MTQGARKKIILSICRLAKRPETLLEIEQVRHILLCTVLHVYVCMGCECVYAYIFGVHDHAVVTNIVHYTYTLYIHIMYIPQLCIYIIIYCVVECQTQIISKPAQSLK